MIINLEWIGQWTLPVGHNNFNCENKPSIGTEVPGNVRAHPLNVEYSTFYFLKLKCINIAQIFSNVLYFYLY